MAAADALGALAKRVPVPASNADFLTEVFGTLPPDVRPMVCGFATDPNDKTDDTGRWGGWTWAPGNASDGDALNWYFTLATFSPCTGGKYLRRVEKCAAIHGVMLDDIGTKASPRSRLDALPPSAMIETSAGNYQAMYLFVQSESDLTRVAALQGALIAAGLCDAGADGPAARWSRMPFGVNTKHAPPHPCRLVEWHPERRYTIEQITQGLALPHVVPAPPRTVTTSSGDWESKSPAEQQETYEHLRSALAYIPSDDRDIWVKVGHYLRTLPEVQGYALFDEWSRFSEKYDEEGMAHFWTFDTKRAGYRSIFTLAELHGWVNPRRVAARQPAAVFNGPCALPPGASLTQPSAAATGAPVVPRNLLLKEDPYGTALALIQRRFTHADGPRLKAWQESFYRWDGAAWCVLAHADVRAELYDFLNREGGLDYRPTQSRVSNLLDSLKAVTHLHSSLAAPCWITGNQPAPAAELVACANALLHLPTRAMLPPTPRLFNLNAVPFNYEPTAPRPVQWLKFLRDVWPADHEAIATLQELFGYLLTPDTSQQKIFLIVGPKRSGKGTIARVLTEMLGGENVAGPTLASMATPFGLAPLVGKLAAVVSDARLSGRTDQQAVAENLLRISGEDRIDVERKFLPSVAMRLGVRFVLLTNELPRIADASGAMASRFVILTMSESFIGREDMGLAAKLLRELPGVLSWAVDGWHRLNARGHFVEPKSSAGAAQDLAELGSPIAAFVREVCQCAPSAEVEASALFSAWRVWCATQGIERVAPSNLFGRDLRAAFPSITRAQSRVGGERVGNYRGIRLRVKSRLVINPLLEQFRFLGLPVLERLDR